MAATKLLRVLDEAGVNLWEIIVPYGKSRRTIIRPRELPCNDKHEWGPRGYMYVLLYCVMLSVGFCSNVAMGCVFGDWKDGDLVGGICLG